MHVSLEILLLLTFAAYFGSAKYHRARADFQLVLLLSLDTHNTYKWVSGL